MTLPAQQQLWTDLSAAFGDGAGEAQQRDPRRRLNTLKMLCYLLCQTAEAFEAEACKPSIDTAVKGARVRLSEEKKNPARDLK